MLNGFPVAITGGAGEGDLGEVTALAQVFLDDGMGPGGGGSRR